MIDHYGRKIEYLRLSVTDKCNLRCRYCMPEEGVCKKAHEEMLTEEEMILAVRAAASLGITKVRITGGEPLLKKNIVSICRRIAAVPGIEEVCITTNGTLLADMAKELQEAGVRRINISLDTLDAEKYSSITRREMQKEAMAGLKAALNAGFDYVKLNTVLIGGFNEDEIVALADLTKAYPMDVRFIELMPMYDGGDFDAAAYLSCEKVLEALPEAEALPEKDGVARRYHLPNAKGNIGLISPISNHFCKTCNRLRLTADGKLKPCLHSAEEYSIKGLDETEMVALFRKAILAKPAKHEELSANSRSKAGRNMNQIGG